MNTILKIFLALILLTAAASSQPIPLRAGGMQTGTALGAGTPQAAASPVAETATASVTAGESALDTGAAGENHPPKVIDLLTDIEGSCRPGAVVTWAAEASDPEGDPVLYQFWLNGPSTGNVWRAMTNWSREGSWSWFTSQSDAGSSIVAVRIRDQHHAAPEGWDDIMTSEYTVQSSSQGRIPAITDLRSDKQSPQPQGARVTWIGEASDPDGDPVLYQFWLKGPSTQEEWISATPWTTQNTWTWSSVQAHTGIYLIELRVRDGYHTGPEASDDSLRAMFVIRQFVK